MEDEIKSDFSSGEELLKLCKKRDLKISQAMMIREVKIVGNSEKTIETKWQRVLSIMKRATSEPIINPKKSMGGLIGGEAKLVYDHEVEGKSVCGSVLSKAIAYSMAVLEVNASMGLIVAAPTAGSSGVLPGVLLALSELYKIDDCRIYEGLSCASAIGYIVMANSSVSGAEAGCQAEVGTAAAMTAAAVTELMGGSPEMCLNAASLAISNLLGLVCDPIAGLVEVPCQSRNAIGAANALTSAELALSGVLFPITFDEMIAAMLKVGRTMPVALRETSMGGCATTPSGCKIANSIYNINH